VSLEDQLAELERAVQAGKVRHIGLSNETPWGVMTAIAAGAHAETELDHAVVLRNLLNYIQIHIIISLMEAHGGQQLTSGAGTFKALHQQCC
jgi:aryl-alcohol dehydrogenase-like predicted oxidoreductase